MARFATAILFVFCALPAAAAEMPSRKAGLWEIKTTAADGRAMAIQQCVDARTDQAMQTSTGAMAQQNCSKRELQKSGDTVTIDSVCTFGARTMTSHVVVTGSFDSGYSMVITSQTQGLPAARTTTMTAKWLGACTGDQKPGDTIMPNGMKMNLLDMQRGRGLPGAPGAPPQH